MNPLTFIPGKREKRWLFLIIPMTAGIAAVLALISWLFLQIHFSAMDYLLFLMMAGIASVAICGFGYAGFLIASASSLLGTVAGISFMTYVFTRPTQWRGITGLASGAQLAFVFFLVGANIQMIYCTAKKRRKMNG